MARRRSCPAEPCCGFRSPPSPAIVETCAGLQRASHQEQTSIWEDIVMKRWSALGAALLLVGFAAFSTSHPVSADDGWVTLFDGKSLDNFNTIGTANWRVEDGV